MHEDNQPPEGEIIQGPTDNEDYVVWQAVLEYEPMKFKEVNQKDFLNDPNAPHYELLPRDQLRVFRMISVADGRVLLQVPFKEGQGNRLIWRRRRQMVPGMGEVWFYLVGKRGGFVSTIMPDLSLVVDDKFDNDNVLFMDVEAVQGEEGYEGDQ